MSQSRRYSCMQLHHYKPILRLASCSSVLPKISKKYLSGVNAPRIIASKAFDGTMGKEKVQFLLKTPKGTKDCDFSPIKSFECKIAYANIISGEGKDMVIRDRIFSTIISVFKRHGAVTIDTYSTQPSKFSTVVNMNLLLVRFLNSKRFSPENMAKTVNLSMTSPTKGGNSAPFVMT